MLGSHSDGEEHLVDIEEKVEERKTEAATIADDTKTMVAAALEPTETTLNTVEALDKERDEVKASKDETDVDQTPEGDEVKRRSNHDQEDKPRYLVQRSIH